MRRIISAFLATGLLSSFIAMQTHAASLKDAFEWWRSASKVQQKVEKLAEDPVEEIPIPVLFLSLDDVTPDFKTPRRTRLHEGQDMMAPRGIPVISPTDAVVIHTAYGAGEGNAVYTANPGGETFVYYHLDRIGEGVAAGTALEKGDLVGYVGDTGDAGGGTPHLHFEIRDDSAVPTDPYPRLEDSSLEEKISILSEILDEEDDEDELAELLVKHFRSAFALALSEDIDLPESIADAMASGKDDDEPEAKNEKSSDDLSEGSLGQAVLALQKFLIEADSGNAAANLKDHGPTGYFGPLTKAALAEYQRKMDIDSRLGYYDKATREFVEDHPITLASSKPPKASDPSDEPKPSEEPDVSDDEPEVTLADSKKRTPLVINRNLFQGVGGEDVLKLQKFLNREGHIVSPVGNGSPGNEIPHFGPGTRAAVIKFQLANNISPAVGFVGPITRSFLASL